MAIASAWIAAPASGSPSSTRSKSPCYVSDDTGRSRLQQSNADCDVQTVAAGRCGWAQHSADSQGAENYESFTPGSYGLGMRGHSIIALALVATPASAQHLSGAANVVDGDTLVVNGTKVRLVGIDAPELDQPCMLEATVWACGEDARTQLSALVEAHIVHCRGQDTDRYGRFLATCSANGLDLGATMTEAGWATAYRTYSDAYIAQEYRARAAKAGIWRSEFVLPEYYRIARAEAVAPAAPRTTPSARAQPRQQGCSIKGNRSRRGEWIYHMPGMRYYERTRPEEIFCSEAEARAAGYRRSKV